MKYFQRSLAAAAVVFVFLSSILILPAPASARTKRCPEPIPDSLLTLYLKSDLVVEASLESEKVLKTTEEFDHGLYQNVEKILDIDKTFKGQKTDSAVYEISEYKPKIQDTSEEVVEEIEDTLKFGEKALFFLVKNADSGHYELTHYSAAIKQLNETDLNLYEKRIRELKSILSKDKDRHARLGEWLVRLIEEPATREEGVRDLLASFTHSDYEDEYVEEVTDAKPTAEERAEQRAEAKTEESGDKKTAAFDKDFRTSNAPEIAASLTDSQKSRISNTLFALLSSDLTHLDNAESEEYFSPDYELITLVARWDKQNFAMSLYANLQNAKGANSRKDVYLMRTIANFLEDENFYLIVNDYEYAASQNENEEMNYTGSTLESIENPAAESAENVETVSENTTAAETENQNAPEVSAETEATVLPVPAEKMEEKTVVKMTYKQYKAKSFDAFTAQYGKVISQTIAAK